MSEKREITRAEAVRQRRAQQAAKELQQASVKAVKQSSVLSSRPAPKPVEKSRRYQSAVSLPRITWNKPQIEAKRQPMGSRWLSLFLAIVLGAAIYFAWTLPYFHITGASVFGNQRISREEIDSVLGLTNQSIFLVQPEDVELRLRMNYPELQAVQVDVYLPNYVYVTVAERQPVILWQQNDGYTWIDSSGVAFRPRGGAEGLIHVVGLATPPTGGADANDPLAPTPFMQQPLVDAIIALAPGVPVDSVLTFDPNEGLGWKDNRGWNVYFGMDAKEMPLKMRVYQSLVETLTTQGIYPKFINVAYPEAPFYRLSEGAFAEETVVEEQSASTDSGQ